MKYFTPILILLSINAIAQDTIIKGKPDNKIYKYGYKYGKQYEYHSNIIGDLAMRDVLLNTNDKDILAKVKSIKRYQGLQLIGALAVPFAVATITYYRKIPEYVSGTQSGIVPGGGGGYYIVNKQNQEITEICFAFTIACPVAAIAFKHKRIKLTKQAIELYNQKY